MLGADKGVRSRKRGCAVTVVHVVLPYWRAVTRRDGWTRLTAGALTRIRSGGDGARDAIDGGDQQRMRIAADQFGLRQN